MSTVRANLSFRALPSKKCRDWAGMRVSPLHSYLPSTDVGNWEENWFSVPAKLGWWHSFYSLDISFAIRKSRNPWAPAGQSCTHTSPHHHQLDPWASGPEAAAQEDRDNANLGGDSAATEWQGKAATTTEDSLPEPMWLWRYCPRKLPASSLFCLVGISCWELATGNEYIPFSFITCT